MVEINLLPWREYRYVYQIKKFNQIIISTSIVAVIFVCGLHVMLMHLLQREVNRLAIMQTELQQFHFTNEISNKKENIPIQHFTLANKLFQLLVSKWPENVCFAEIIQDKHVTVFTGYAETAEEFTEFIKHWDMAHLFASLNIEYLKYQESEQAVQFRFRAFEAIS